MRVLARARSSSWSGCIIGPLAAFPCSVCCSCALHLDLAAAPEESLPMTHCGRGQVSVSPLERHRVMPPEKPPSGGSSGQNSSRQQTLWRPSGRTAMLGTLFLQVRVSGHVTKLHLRVY